ncbi:MAG: c-type cytochrome [Chloroflexota bacterium]
MLVKRLQLYVGWAALAVIMAGCGGLAGEPIIVSTVPAVVPTAQTISLPQTAPDLALGASVYAANCTRCHGVTGIGDGEFAKSGQVTGVPDFTDPQTSQNASVGDWYEIVTNGRMDKLMPPWGDKLSDLERWSVTNYVYSLGGRNVPAATEVAIVQVATPAAPNATEELGAVLPPASTLDVGTGGAAISGTVAGKVVNQTAGSSVPPDLALNLHAISPDQSAQAQTFQGTVGADGSYHFDNVPIQAGWQYLLTTSYENAVFNSTMITADGSLSQLDIPLTIYEVTNDPAKLQINGLMMMVQSTTQTGQLEVVQIASFSNPTDRAFVQSGDGTSVSLRLPAGATYEDFSGGGYLVSADGLDIVDTQPVLPGVAHVMHIAFTVPYSGTINLAQTLDYPLEGQVEVLLDNSDMAVSGTGIAALGTRQLGSRSYVSYGGTFTHAAGESLSYEIGGTTTQTTTATGISGVSIVAFILIGIGLLAIGAAFGFFMRERTNAPKDNDLNINVLVKQIAELDVRYKDGKLAEAKYQQQRSALKAQLTALMKEKAQSSVE